MKIRISRTGEHSKTYIEDEDGNWVDMETLDPIPCVVGDFDMRIDYPCVPKDALSELVEDSNKRELNGLNSGTDLYMALRDAVEKLLEGKE